MSSMHTTSLYGVALSLKRARTNVDEKFKEWFAEATEPANDADVKPTAPRILLHASKIQTKHSC